MKQLSASERAALAALPLPADPAEDTCVVAAPGGWSVAWARDGGRRKERIGPAFADPLRASEASRFLRDIHGLRA